MPFIVRILKEDVALWKEADPAPHREKFLYTPRGGYAGIVVSSLAPLTAFINEDVIVKINIAKNRGADLSLLKIEQLNRKLTGTPRRLRLKIARIEPQPVGPPKVFLEEFT